MANTGNTQQQINYGSTPNDGLGDPLRTAFIKTDQNFDNIWLAGPVGSNVTITNNTIQVNNTNGNLVLQPNGVGVIETRGSLQSFANNIHNLGTANLRYLSAYIGTGGLDVVGTISAGNLSTSGNFSATGLVVTGDARIDGNLRVQGDIIQVGNIVTDTLTIQLANTASTDPQADGAGITVGATDDIATLLYDSVYNEWTTNIGVNAAGNITGSYILGNAAFLTGLPEQYGNANVADYLPVYSGNISSENIGVSGNINVSNTTSTQNLSISKTGNTWYWNGALMLSPTGGSWYSDPDVQEEYISSGVDGYISLQSLNPGPDFGIASEIKLEHGKIRLGVYNGANYEWDFNVDGTMDVPGDILPVANAVQSLGNVNLQWAELWVSNNTIYIGGVALGITGNVLTVDGEPVLSNDSESSISTTGNITADYFFGNGSQLAGLSTVAVSGSYNDLINQPVIPTATSNLVNDSGFITSASIPSNISAFTNDAGYITNATANVVSVNGQTGAVSLSIPTATSNLTNDSGFITSSVTGNLTATGNISANYFIGDGSQLTGLPASYSNANVATFLANFGSNTISTTGNITAGNISGNISITGNVTGTSANVTLVAGSYSTTFDNTGTATFPDDIVTGGGGVINKATGFVNAGTFVTLDNLTVAVTAGGNRGLTIASVSGSFSAFISGSYVGYVGGVAGQGTSQTVTTTPSTSLFGWNFTAQGDTATYIINDTTNNRCYRVTMMIGGSYNNNFISIERL